MAGIHDGRDATALGAQRTGTVLRSAGLVLMRVAVERRRRRRRPALSDGPTWRSGTPTKLFENAYAWTISGFTGRSYDISADGRRFLAIKPVVAEQTGAPTTSLSYRTGLKS